MIHTIVLIVVAGVLVWGATALINACPMNETFRRVANVLVVVVAVLWLVGLVFGVHILPIKL